MSPQYRSVFEALLPLIQNNQSGMLSIHGTFGYTAKIYLRAGCVYHVESGKLTGTPALRALSKHLALMTHFVPDQSPEEILRSRFCTQQILDLLRNAEKIWQVLLRSVFSYDSVFKLAKATWNVQKMSDDQRRVLLALDGRRSVSRVIQETGVSEMDVLYTIYFFGGRGLIERVAHRKVDTPEDGRRLSGRLNTGVVVPSPPASLMAACAV